MTISITIVIDIHCIRDAYIYIYVHIQDGILHIDNHKQYTANGCRESGRHLRYTASGC